MLISIIVGAAVAGMTYAVERGIDRTIQQGRSIKKSGGSIRQTIENTAAGMTYAAMQMEPPPVPQPPYVTDEFDDDDEFFCDCEDVITEEEEAPAEEPETITSVVIEEPEQPAPTPEPPSGKSKKGKK